MSFSTLGAGLDVGTGLLNAGLGIASYNWNKKAQQITWDREDNAVQRRVADLRAAGMSPTLAAGSAASASSPNTLSAPNVQTSLQQKSLNAAALMQAKAQIAKTQSEQQLIDLQYQKAKRDFNIVQGKESGVMSDDRTFVGNLYKNAQAAIGIFKNLKFNGPGSNVYNNAVGEEINNIGEDNNVSSPALVKLNRNTPKTAGKFVKQSSPKSSPKKSYTYYDQEKKGYYVKKKPKSFYWKFEPGQMSTSGAW